MLALLAAAGVDERTAAYAVDTLALYLNATGPGGRPRGARSRSSNRAPRTGTRGTGRCSRGIQQRYASLPPEQFPPVLRMASLMVEDDGEDRFLFGLDVILDGVLAASARVREGRGAGTSP